MRNKIEFWCARKRLYVSELILIKSKKTFSRRDRINVFLLFLLKTNRGRNSRAKGVNVINKFISTGRGFSRSYLGFTLLFFRTSSRTVCRVDFSFTTSQVLQPLLPARFLADRACQLASTHASHLLTRFSCDSCFFIRIGAGYIINFNQSIVVASINSD